jgi:type IV secretory pathway VirB2 component (pilin)
MIVPSLAEAPVPPVLPSAASWIEQAITGNAALLMATIAIATLGYALFMGRLPIRQGLAALAGCFLLFGAPTIGRALQQLGGAPIAAVPDGQEGNLTALPTAQLQADPYAGAGLVP